MGEGSERLMRAAVNRGWMPDDADGVQLNCGNEVMVATATEIPGFSIAETQSSYIVLAHCAWMDA